MDPPSQNRAGPAQDPRPPPPPHPPSPGETGGTQAGPAQDPWPPKLGTSCLPTRTWYQLPSSGRLN